MRVNCKDCGLWHSQENKFGECRKNAPKVVGDDETAVWPVTAFDGWCGEGMARKPEGSAEPDPRRAPSIAETKAEVSRSCMGGK